jgi:hypothetical protein
MRRAATNLKQCFAVDAPAFVAFYRAERCESNSKFICPKAASSFNISHQRPKSAADGEGINKCEPQLWPRAVGKSQLVAAISLSVSAHETPPSGHEIERLL